MEKQVDMNFEVASQKVQIQEKTSKKIAVFYSFGEFGSQLSWYMINTYLMIFYTDIIGLSAAAISMIMLVARIWDAVNDPMMGIVADRTQTRWGKFRPYLIFAPPFLAIFNILTFTVFPVEGVTKVILCLVLYIGAGMSYTALSVGYASLVNRIAKDSQVRMNYTSARAVGGSIVQMILSMAVMPAILFFSNSDVANSRGYFWVTVICSLIMIPAFWLTAYHCKETARTDSRKREKQKISVTTSLKALFKNKMLLITVWSVFLGAMAVIGRMTLLAYYVIYVVGSFTMIAPIFTSMTVFQLIGSMLLPVATKKFGKRNWLLILSLISIVSIFVLFLFPSGNTAFLLTTAAFIGLSSSAGSVSTGMLSDCVEYGDWKYRVRDEGLTFSFLGFGVKLASAIAGAGGVLMLSATGYVPGAVQSQASITGINVIVNLVPAILMVLSILPLYWYKLDKKQMDQIAVELEIRELEEN